MPFLNRGLCWKHLRHTPYAVNHRSAGTRWVASSSSGLKHSRHVITLRPSQMVDRGQQVYDLSGSKNPVYRVKDAVLTLRYTHVTTTKESSFPEGSRGVLYYHHDDHRPPWDGSIRFRICDDVSLFDDGKDLSLPESDEPWAHPLYLLAAGHTYDGVRTLLKEDNVVDPQIIDALYDQRYELPTGNNPHSQILFDFADPFFIDLSVSEPHFWYISPTRSSRYSFCPFTRTYDRIAMNPFAGKVRVRFVPAPLVSKTKDSYGFHLQILDILSPVRCVLENYDYSILEPRVGGLVTRKKGPRKYFCWVYDLVKERLPRRYAPLTRARRD